MLMQVQTYSCIEIAGSPADGDSIGKISFVGDNDAGETTRYARIDNQISDASDGTEDGMMFMTTMVGGTEKSRMTLQPTETVFNEESADIDFRVESDNLTHAIEVNGATGIVGIGCAETVTGLDVDAHGDGTNIKCLIHGNNDGGDVMIARLILLLQILIMNPLLVIYNYECWKGYF